MSLMKGIKMNTPIYKKFLVASAFILVANLSACDRTKETDISVNESTEQPNNHTQSDTSSMETKIANAGDKVERSADNLASSVKGAATTASRAISDSTITAKVKSALIADKDVKSIDIKVETMEGIVTLNGEASSRAQADKAESIARTVDGVKTIDNRIDIKS